MTCGSNEEKSAYSRDNRGIGVKQVGGGTV